MGEGAKTTLVNASDADILRRILEVLRERIEASAATFSIKIKAHRREPVNQTHWLKQEEKSLGRGNSEVDGED